MILSNMTDLILVSHLTTHLKIILIGDSYIFYCFLLHISINQLFYLVSFRYSIHSFSLQPLVSNSMRWVVSAVKQLVIYQYTWLGSITNYRDSVHRLKDTRQYWWGFYKRRFQYFLYFRNDIPTYHILWGILRREV